MIGPLCTREQKYVIGCNTHITKPSARVPPPSSPTSLPPPPPPPPPPPRPPARLAPRQRGTSLHLSIIVSEAPTSRLVDPADGALPPPLPLPLTLRPSVPSSLSLSRARERERERIRGPPIPPRDRPRCFVARYSSGIHNGDHATACVCVTQEPRLLRLPSPAPCPPAPLPPAPSRSRATYLLTWTSCEIALPALLVR